MKDSDGKGAWQVKKKKNLPEQYCNKRHENCGKIFHQKIFKKSSKPYSL